MNLHRLNIMSYKYSQLRPAEFIVRTSTGYVSMINLIIQKLQDRIEKSYLTIFNR